MIKDIDYSFPTVHSSTEKLFSAEINKLTVLWNNCCKSFEENAKNESDYISKCEYDDPEEALMTSSCGIINGSISLVAGIHFAAISSYFAPIFCCLGGSSLAYGIDTWTAITDTNNRLNQFMDFRLEAHRTIDKIERCLQLMNQIGEFSSAWDTAKTTPSDENLDLLLKSFKHFQKAELGILTDKIDETASPKNLQVTNKIVGLQTYIAEAF